MSSVAAPSASRAVPHTSRTPREIGAGQIVYTEAVRGDRVAFGDSVWDHETRRFQSVLSVAPAPDRAGMVVVRLVGPTGHVTRTLHGNTILDVFAPED